MTGPPVDLDIAPSRIGMFVISGDRRFDYDITDVINDLDGLAVDVLLATQGKQKIDVLLRLLAHPGLLLIKTAPATESAHESLYVHLDDLWDWVREHRLGLLADWVLANVPNTDDAVTLAGLLVSTFRQSRTGAVSALPFQVRQDAHDAVYLLAWAAGERATVREVRGRGRTFVPSVPVPRAKMTAYRKAGMLPNEAQRIEAEQNPEIAHLLLLGSLRSGSLNASSPASG